jgi:hypothetical protein
MTKEQNLMSSLIEPSVPSYADFSAGKGKFTEKEQNILSPSEDHPCRPLPHNHFNAGECQYNTKEEVQQGHK